MVDRSMANEAIVQVLEEMAFLAELKGENPFKIRALQNSANILSELSQTAEELIQSGEISKIPGVGKGTQAMVKEFVEKGSVKEHADLKSSFPPGILELREVRGLGPKKIKALFDQLNISSLAELEYACQENRLVDLKGFGEKTQSNILANIQKLKGYKGKVILPAALQEVDSAREILEGLQGVKEVREAGEIRRKIEIISALDFLLVGDVKKMRSALEIENFEKIDDDRFERATEGGLKMVAWLASPENAGSRWVESTGPDSFVDKLGIKSSEATEEAAFQSAKIEFIEPECRDLGVHPKHLLEVEEIKGVFHLHTQWSDGKNTLEEMVQTAEELGFEYLGVSDHSQTAFYANGLDEKRVLQQKKEIEKVQEKYPKVRVFHGIESDILADGSLDYPKAFLKNFDFVIASVHGQMKMKREEMTKRLCAALENPYTTWLGHWTGRLLLGRDGYDFDVEKVLKVAAKEGKSIELNSNPYRLDVDWRLLPRLKEMGISIGIHPDAHSTHGLEDVKYGVWMARKAGLSTNDIVNTRSRKEMEAWLAERKPH